MYKNAIFDKNNKEAKKSKKYWTNAKDIGQKAVRFQSMPFFIAGVFYLQERNSGLFVMEK